MSLRPHVDAYNDAFVRALNEGKPLPEPPLRPDERTADALERIADLLQAHLELLRRTHPERVDLMRQRASSSSSAP